MYSFIKEIRPLYKNDNIVNAYHFKLANGLEEVPNGYIIISKSKKINFIQEFSDKGLSSKLFEFKLVD